MDPLPTLQITMGGQVDTQGPPAGHATSIDGLLEVVFLPVGGLSFCVYAGYIDGQQSHATAWQCFPRQTGLPSTNPFGRRPGLKKKSFGSEVFLPRKGIER